MHLLECPTRIRQPQACTFLPARTSLRARSLFHGSFSLPARGKRHHARCSESGRVQKQVVDQVWASRALRDFEIFDSSATTTSRVIELNCDRYRSPAGGRASPTPSPITSPRSRSDVMKASTPLTSSTPPSAPTGPEWPDPHARTSPLPPWAVCFGRRHCCCCRYDQHPQFAPPRKSRSSSAFRLSDVSRLVKGGH